MVVVNEIPEISTSAVLVESEALPSDAREVRGYDFEDVEGVDYEKMFSSYATSGFQATHLGQAIEVVNGMIDWRPSAAQISDGIDSNTQCKIFLGYTSNMVSSGNRESIRYLVKHKHVDVLVSTAGGIEEDIMKCLAPSVIGSFSLGGEELRKRGINRIGNTLVPNKNYCMFQDWLIPVLNRACDMQTNGHHFTPSELIKLMGESIAHEDSICYWAARNGIPIFCPAITDGAIGDVIFFHSYKRSGFILDLVEDIRRINKLAIGAPCTGMLILGGGVIKHHVANANLMRNGADYAVYINTANEYDGSDAGASTEEAVSWGKIKANARRVKVCAEATLILPILISQTFAKKRGNTQKVTATSSTNGASAD